MPTLRFSAKTKVCRRMCRRTFFLWTRGREKLEIRSTLRKNDCGQESEIRRMASATISKFKLSNDRNEGHKLRLFLRRPRMAISIMVLCFITIYYTMVYDGAVAERFKATVLKTVLPFWVTGVRIPPAPLAWVIARDMRETGNGESYER